MNSFIELHNKIKTFKRLIKAQEEYINFLTKEIDRSALYLAVRGEGPNKDIVNKGIELRDKIKSLK